jgi:hypothetical protein
MLLFEESTLLTLMLLHSTKRYEKNAELCILSRSLTREAQRLHSEERSRCRRCRALAHLQGDLFTPRTFPPMGGV